MAAVRTLLAGVALVAGMAGTANAADLPPIYETPVYAQPIYADVPEVVPVEIGSGWYLRGDVSYEFKSSIDARNREFRPDYDAYDYDPASPFSGSQYGSFDGGRSDFDLAGKGTIGIGVGYQFTDFFRGDLTARYWEADVDGDRRIASCFEGAAAFTPGIDTGALDCGSNTSGNATGVELMANAYADLGTFVGLTPYVGGGLGAVRVSYDDISIGSRCSYAGSVCDPAFYDYDSQADGAESWRFAYALMAGVSYDISKNLKLDIGYRFLDVDGGRMYAHEGDVVGGQTIGVDADDDGFMTHSIQAGLRYALW